MFDGNAFLLVTKLAPLVVYPLGLSFLLALFGGLCATCRLWRPAVSSAAAAVVVLWVCSTPVFAAWALGTLERQYAAKAMVDTPEADVAIVLGGAIGQPVPPRVVLDLTAAADRVLHAARLYKAGKIKRILVTAGNVSWYPSVKPEAELISELLVEWGVPAAAIEIAAASRNTYENVLEIKAIQQKWPFKSALLVTSAAHMPRAMAVFRRAGLAVTASTTDVNVVDEPLANPLLWLPDAGALAMTTAATKEWIGILTYRLRGYV